MTNSMKAPDDSIRWTFWRTGSNARIFWMTAAPFYLASKVDAINGIQWSSLFLLPKEGPRGLSLKASVTDLFRVLDEEEERPNQSSVSDLPAMSPLVPTPVETVELQEVSISDDDDNNDYVVSDAEALLACWSFLKRRKRLGKWVEYEERQAQKALSKNYFLTDDEIGDEAMEEDDDDDDEEDSALENNSEPLEENNEWIASVTKVQDMLLPSSTLDDDYETENYDIDLQPFESVGTTDLEEFWEETEEDFGDDEPMITVQDLLLRGSPLDVDYYRFDSDPRSETDDAVAKDFKLISSLISEDKPKAPVKEPSEKVEIDLWNTEFTSFPTEPSDSRTRRVNAMKKRWENPDYREKWYEKRWGERKRKQQTEKLQTDQERTAIQRARALPSGFLGSDELASMTEDEIAEAIKVRIESTAKRVATRKRTLEERKRRLATQMESLEVEALSSEDTNEDLPRDVLYNRDPLELSEAQRKRSEHAKELYATRRKNQKETSHPKRSSPNKGPYFPPKQQTPRDAFLRIENDLECGVKPSINDVFLLLEPGRMKDRKHLLGRILLDEFQLRGKCVPPLTGNKKDLDFVQNCTIERLGKFVIDLLKEGKKRED